MGLKQKRILIVGGAGYIGGFMTDILSARSGYSIDIYDNLLYEGRFLKDVNFIYGDIRDTGKLRGIIGEYDAVVWLAALVGDGACAVNPSLAQEINTETVKWLVDNYHGKIIFTSTCSVYGINNDLIDEDAVPNPLSVYASTKLEAEQYIRKNAGDYLVFRLGTLYGIGDSHSRVRFDLVANILTLRAVNGETLKVFGGEQWRPLLHVRDVSYAVEYCLYHDITGLYNLSECNQKISQLAGVIASHVPGSRVEYTDMKFEDMRNYKVKNEKILSSGWKPKMNLDDGIDVMVRIFKENRIKDISDPVYSNVAYLKELNNRGQLC